MKRLSEHGIGARYLEGGMDAWKAAQGPLDAKPAGRGTRWVTRERPKIDRIACPWLVARFIDRDAEFLYVPAPQVGEVAQAQEAVPYDVAGVHFTHEGERCSFDAFTRHYRLGSDPALERLALIVRAADTATLDRSQEAPGLLAISLVMSETIRDDILLLEQAMLVYDSLYAWCKIARDETHSWPQTKGVPA